MWWRLRLKMSPCDERCLLLLSGRNKAFEIAIDGTGGMLQISLNPTLTLERGKGKLSRHPRPYTLKPFPGTAHIKPWVELQVGARANGLELPNQPGHSLALS